MEFNNVYSGKRVLLTGHTGFKGSWLALWLQRLGAEVYGIALPPEGEDSHWERLNLDMQESLIDIRDADALGAALHSFKPDAVFHLAAQPLVRRSYDDPLTTWSTNVVGTANLLEACRKTGNVQAIIAVTTDKCYENKEWDWGYREVDRLGGHDPYSASKAGSELVVSSYRNSFFTGNDVPLLATARAGNVIGGGDWSDDRLIPDLARAMGAKKELIIRSPHATRPWQHVLESLSGYLLLGQQLLQGADQFADAWNFGPGPEGNLTVNDILQKMKGSWSGLNWKAVNSNGPHEANLLQLDCAKAHKKLNWQPVWKIDDGLKATAEWYKAWISDRTLISNEQLNTYIMDAGHRDVCWAGK